MATQLGMYEKLVKQLSQKIDDMEKDQSNYSSLQEERDAFELITIEMESDLDKK